VTDQYNVTEAGVSSVSYLFFDGADSMATPSINFTSTDKMTVFAGVRKLSDPVGIIAELSPTVDTNNGSIVLYSTSPSKWGFASRGTAVSVAEASGYSPPLTSVLTGLGDISGDRATIRVNGAQITQSTADQGTGNLLAYPLYIGARAGTSFFFSGHLYSLIVRGAASTIPEIQATERYVATRTSGVILP
jgi:hypothetical protein